MTKILVKGLLIIIFSLFMKTLIIGLCMMILMLRIVNATTYYVNASMITCDDLSTTGNITNPYCTFSIGQSVLIDGDTLWVANGSYNNQSTAETIRDKVFTTGVTIAGIPGDYPVISAYQTSYTNSSNNTKWSNMSNSSIYLWNSTFTVTATNINVMRNDNVSLLVYLVWSDFLNASLPSGFYWNDTINQIYLKLNDSSNPAYMGFYISRFPAVLTIRNVTGTIGLTIANMSFIGGLDGIIISHANVSDNIKIIGNTFKGFRNGINIMYAGNITVKDNNFLNIPDAGWDWTTTYNTLNGGDSWAVKIYSAKDNINVSNNKISGYFNGIYGGGTTAFDFINPDISYNNITNIMDDALELERRWNGGTIHHNRINDSFVGISIMPTNASLGNTPLISFNIIMANKSILAYHSGTIWQGECFKLKQSTGVYTDALVNFNISQNTCFGDEGAVGLGTNYNHTQINTSWTNNIFYCQDDVCVYKTGLATDDVFWDYNLYYSEANDNLISFYNSDTNYTAYNLSEVLASSLWDGTWDVNSLQSNPLFVSGSYQPAYNSPACNMSSTGSYVGALPCDANCLYSGSGNFTIENTTCNITTNANILRNYFIISNSTVYNSANVTNWSEMHVRNGAIYHKI